MKLNHLTTTVVFVAAGILLAVSCGHESKEKTQVTHADSVLFAAGRALDYTRLLELTDSFEHEGAITRMNANRFASSLSGASFAAARSNSADHLARTFPE